MEKPLLLLALVPLAVGLVLIYVVIGSKNREANAKGLFCVSSQRSWSLPARWPSRDNSYDASRCGMLSRLLPRPFPALRAIPAITSLPRSQAHETLGAMTTIIMRTSDDNRMWSFLALFQGFPFLGNLPITLVFHEAPTGTQE